MSTVTLCHSSDRPYGVRAALTALGWSASHNPVRGQDVLLKPNLNTADPAPGSTDNATLEALVDQLWDLGAASITLGERSLGATRRVMEDKGLLSLARRKQVEVLVFDELPEEDWVLVKTPGHHWPQGFRVARPLLDSSCVVQTCCLKTHGHGGVFSMSLKLAVGFLPGLEQDPVLMRTLHGSRHQRRMIAEINTAFSPALVVLDGVDAFVDGGPQSGQRVAGRVMLASADRVAIDAAGLACLKLLGANQAIMSRPVFQQEQIRRAVELGLGASGPAEIQLAAADEHSADQVRRVRQILDEDGPGPGSGLWARLRSRTGR